MRKLLLKILPDRIIEIYKGYKRKLKGNQRKTLEQAGKITTQKQIEKFLINNGIEQGDTVMLHSSLSKIGFVEQGAETIINSFLNVLGKSGTLAMPSFPAIGFNYDYLKSGAIFDIKNTASKMGIVTEVFRKMKDVQRSFHPTDPVCVIGSHAKYLANTHFMELTPYNSNSPFYKLCELKAKIIMLGVDLDSLTNLHTLEDTVQDFKFPVYHSHVFECEMINENKERVKVKTKCHDPKWSKQRKCNELVPLFKNSGFLKEAKLGEANVYIIEAKAMHEWMVKNYKEKGITMYTPQGS